MLIDDRVSCGELLAGTRKPVTSRIAGELLPGKAYSRQAPFFVDTKEIGSDSSAYYRELFQQIDCREIPIHLFEFQNAIVFGQGSVVIGNRSILTNSALEFINHQVAPDGASSDGSGYRLPSGAPDVLRGRSVLVKRPWYRNFGHWLVDLMPILPLLAEAAIDVDTIIFGDVHEGTLKTIMQGTSDRFFPSSSVVFATDTSRLRCEHLYYVEPLHVPPLFKHPMAMDTTEAASRKIFPSADPFSADGRKLYISRSKSGARNVSNEADLIQFLEGRGFETVFPEEYSFPEQIALFESARILIGTKGAAFTNTIFCKPGTHVLVLSPPDFIDTFFWDLMTPRGVHYSEIFCRSSAPGAPSMIDFVVSLQSVDRFLASI